MREAKMLKLKKERALQEMAKKNLEDNERKRLKELEEERMRAENRDVNEKEADQLARLNKQNEGNYYGESKYAIQGFGKGKKIALKRQNQDMNDYPEFFETKKDENNRIDI